MKIIRFRYCILSFVSMSLILSSISSATEFDSKAAKRINAQSSTSPLFLSVRLRFWELIFGGKAFAWELYSGDAFTFVSGLRNQTKTELLFPESLSDMDWSRFFTIRLLKQPKENPALIKGLPIAEGVKPDPDAEQIPLKCTINSIELPDRLTSKTNDEVSHVLLPNEAVVTQWTIKPLTKKPLAAGDYCVEVNFIWNKQSYINTSCFHFSEAKSLDDRLNQLINQATRAIEDKDYTKAKLLLLTIVGRKPNSIAVLTLLSKTYEELNDPKNALSYLKQAYLVAKEAKDSDYLKNFSKFSLEEMAAGIQIHIQFLEKQLKPS